MTKYSNLQLKYRVLGNQSHVITVGNAWNNCNFHFSMKGPKELNSLVQGVAESLDIGKIYPLRVIRLILKIKYKRFFPLNRLREDLDFLQKRGYVEMVCKDEYYLWRVR